MVAAHRVRQFLAALTASVARGEQSVPAQYLSAKQLALFWQMRVNDQRHALTVLYKLHVAGYNDPELLQAALLHDVGKSEARLGLLIRVMIVLLRRVDGRIVERLGGVSPVPRWRRAFYVHTHHARIGAELAAAAGSSAEVVRLIREHGCPPSDDLARALYEADEWS